MEACSPPSDGEVPARRESSGGDELTRLSYRAPALPPREIPTMEGRNLDAVIGSLLNTEKQCCLAGKVAGSRKSAVDIVEICFKDIAWKMLNDQIIFLSNRRGQLKQEVAEIKEEQGKIDEAIEIKQEVVECIHELGHL